MQLTTQQGRSQRGSGGSGRFSPPLCMICHDGILFWTLEPRCTCGLRSVHWLDRHRVLLTLVTYNIKLYLPRILIQSPCLFMYTLGQVYNSALTLWRTSRLHDGLDRSVRDTINVFNILESVVFLVFYITFSNLQNFVKSSPKLQEIAFQRL